MNIGKSILIGLLCLASRSEAQENAFGFTIPITLTGETLYTHRLQKVDPSASPFTPAIRAFLAPRVQLGAHWFASASLNVSSTPFFPFQAYGSGHELFTRWIQAYAGYKYQSGQNTLTVKAGQFAVGFGSFPMRYEDDVNPLIDVPVGYGASEYGPLQYPITLYGLPGVEADLNSRNADMRLQFVNSSPANPRRLFGGGQNPNWVAGAGYTVRQGLRIGTSFYRGGYLTTGQFLLPTEKSGDWPATGIGFDGQWNTGHWTINGEWQRFFLPYPRFKINPEVTTAYAEVNRTLLPRVFVAGRIGRTPHSTFQSALMPSPIAYPPGRCAYEVALGYRLNRAQLLKVGYEWSAKDQVRGTLDNVLGLQFVTTLPMLSRTF